MRKSLLWITPLQHASSREYREIEKRLLAAGAK